METPHDRGRREARLLQELLKRHSNDPAALQSLFTHPSAAGQELVRSLNEVHVVLARAAEHTANEAALAATLSVLDEIQSALALYYALPLVQGQQSPQQSASSYYYPSKPVPALPATPPLPPKVAASGYIYSPHQAYTPPHQQQRQQPAQPAYPQALPPLPQVPSSYYQAQQLHQQQQQQQQQQTKLPQQLLPPLPEPRPQAQVPWPVSPVISASSSSQVGLAHLLEVDDPDWLRATARAAVTVRTADAMYEGEVQGTLADMQRALQIITVSAEQHQHAAPAVGTAHSAHSHTGASTKAPASGETIDPRKKRGLLNDLTKASPYGLGAIPVKEPGDTEKGPQQQPKREVIKLPNNMHTRVVPPSKQRGYDLDGYEEFALIDPKRTMKHVLRVDTDWELVDNPPDAADPAVMYEVAAVAAKIRNTHKVGGERVKEMQFFVESVETPEVRVKAPDIAPLLKSICEASALEPIMVDGKWPFYVQDKYRPPSASMLAHARILHRLLEIICCEIYTHGMDKVRLCYMTTIRADFSVAAKSEVDGNWYFNVMAFEQQDCCDVAAGLPKADRRPWVYYTERVGMLNGVKPWGLYNKDVRQRLYAYLDALGLQR